MALSLAVSERLLGAFPSSVRAAVDAGLEFLRAAPAADLAREPSSATRLDPSHDDIGPVAIAGQPVNIPSRVYFAPPRPEQLSQLTADARLAMACLMTRHHDGFVRQRALSQVLTGAAPWVPPFVIQLAGEYVIEIVEQLAACARALPIDLYRRFATENAAFLRLTRQRMVSDWHCYHRTRFTRLTDYPGYGFLATLGLWEGREARRLLEH